MVAVSSKPSLGNSSSILASQMLEVENNGLQGYTMMSTSMQLENASIVYYANIVCFDKNQLHAKTSSPAQFSFKKIWITTPYSLDMTVDSDELTATLIWKMTKIDTTTVAGKLISWLLYSMYI